MRYNFFINGCEVKWQYIKDFYEKDSIMSLCLAPKLSPKHIYCNNFEKMHVCLAAEVFSRSVAAGIHTYIEFGALPKEALHTAQFVNEMDKLFDTFNSSQINHYKDNKCAIAEIINQLNGLDDFERWISSWQIIGTKRVIPCISGWKLNIASLKLLWHDVHDNYQYKYLMTNRLNQDCLENLFNTIRNAGGNNDTPTAQIFKKLINGMMSNNIMQTAVKGNCLDDAMPMLQFMKTHDKSNFHICKETDSQKAFDNEVLAEAKDFLYSNNEAQENNDIGITDTSILSDQQDYSDNCNIKQNTNTLSKFFSDFNPFHKGTDLLSKEVNEANNMSPASNSLSDFFSSFNPYREESDLRNNVDSNNKIKENIISYIAGYVCHGVLKHH